MVLFTEFYQSEYLTWIKHETFHSNHNDCVVKSLARASDDKESIARETLESSFTSDWKERNLRKLKGDTKNSDVENRWREISKVSILQLCIQL